MDAPSGLDALYNYRYTYDYTCRECNEFASVCLFVCLLLYLFVSRITPKLIDECLLNFLKR